MKSCHKKINKVQITKYTRYLGISLYYRQGSLLSMTVSESVSNHDSTTATIFCGSHFMLSHGGSAVCQNWKSVGGIKFSRNRNPCLTCIRSAKKQQIKGDWEDGQIPLHSSHRKGRPFTLTFITTKTLKL